MKRAGLAILALVALALPALTFSSSSASLYNRGNELYKAESYKDAAAAYSQAAATGIKNSELFYNLGNAHLRDGQLGPAIAAYLRAERLAPRDPDIRFNLNYARGKVAAKLPEDQRGPLYGAFNSLVGLVSVNEVVAIFTYFYWSLAAAVLGLILGRGERLRGLCRNYLYLAAALLILFLPVAGTRFRRDVFTSKAVMLTKETARSGPGETNTALLELAEGVEVNVGQCESGWCRVSARGGFNGWVEAKSFERL